MDKDIKYFKYFLLFATFLVTLIFISGIINLIVSEEHKIINECNQTIRLNVKPVIYITVSGSRMNITNNFGITEEMCCTKDMSCISIGK